MLRRIKQPTFPELYAPRLITVLRETIARAVADLKGEREKLLVAADGLAAS